MTAGEKAVAGGFLLGTGGALVGTITGVLARKNFIVDGKKERFRDLQSEIRMKLSKN